MSLSQALLAELEHEAATTRRVLERVPETQLGWKPHEKSMTLGRLAGHVAELPSWIVSSVRQDELDFAPVGGPAYVPPNPETTHELLAFFDQQVADAKAALAELSDEAAGHPWKLLMGGHEIFTLPKVVVIRTWVMNHTYHHRGQLSVYLRLLDVPVPSIYGPTADEGGM